MGLRKVTISFGVVVVLFSCQPEIPTDVSEHLSKLPDRIDFNYHVKPILSDRCFKCHGTDANQRKGDLRLDLASEAYKKTLTDDARTSRVIVPGSTRRSDLIWRLFSNDPNYVMPPPESHLDLSAEEKAILIRWIEQGAEYKDHWAFLKPEHQKIPETPYPECTVNSIDHFILSKIKEQQLLPGKPADAETLLRRISLDLTGLPPDLKEQESLLKDTSTMEVERAINHFMAQPHFGERLALEWLDVARYADSHGYQDDGMRNTWPYRDWVIRAFNENLPHDTFLLWQLAGDMLENPTQDQLLATCFNRNHPQTQEGGVVDEEYRVEYVADRTNTLGKAILGLTLECARCHDHKYDPFTQKDYFGLYAYFNNNNDAGIVPYNGEASPTMILPEPGVEKKLDSLLTKIGNLEKTGLTTSQYRSSFEKWYQSTKPDSKTLVSDTEGLLARFSFEKEYSVAKYELFLDKGKRPQPAKGEKPSRQYAYFNDAKGKLDALNWGHIDDRPLITDEGYEGNAISFQGDGGIRFNRDLDFDRDQPFAVSVWVKFTREGEEGPVFGKANGDFEGYRGWLCNLNPDGTLSFQLNHVWPDNSIDFQTVNPVPLNEWLHIVLSYDGSSKAAGVRFYINGVTPEHLLHADHLKKSLLHGVKGSNWSNQPFLVGMELRKSMEYMLMDELRVYNRPLSYAEVKYLYNKQIPDDPELWFEYYLFSRKDVAYNKVQRELQELRRQENLLITDQPEVMTMREKKYPRKTYRLDRGVYDAPQEEIEPAIPALFSGAKSVGRNRLDLACWVISPENPLTARAAVNRLWKICFGKGLVSTQEDFGSQGSLPSHPELLDYLALRFIELDWNVKDMLREIMLSATYRQSSKPNPENAEKDPTNAFYSYYPAHRLSAELIRDQALAASDLLVPKIGGPSVYPYQPEGIWEALATRNATTYRQQSGDSLYRRSLYTVWKRSSPPPSMLNFDAPDRYYCVVRRQQTATPLQSLVLMNDPQFVEAARILAEKMAGEPNTDAAIKLAYKKLLSRTAREEELKTLNTLYQQMLEPLKGNQSKARLLLATGEAPRRSSEPEEKVAAYTLVASTLMNYDDFVVKR